MTLAISRGIVNREVMVTSEYPETNTWRDYADPVPHVADHRVADSESAWGAWTRTGSTCARITNTGNTGSDDDDDNTPFHTPTNNNNGGNTAGNNGGGHPGIDSTPKQDADRDEETGGWRT